MYQINDVVDYKFIAMNKITDFKKLHIVLSKMRIECEAVCAEINSMKEIMLKSGRPEFRQFVGKSIDILIPMLYYRELEKQMIIKFNLGDVPEVDAINRIANIDYDAETICRYIKLSSKRNILQKNISDLSYTLEYSDMYNTDRTNQRMEEDAAIVVKVLESVDYSDK